MLIVAGHLQIAPDARDNYLAIALEATRLARDASGCLEFVQAPDPLTPDRIFVYERWESEEALLTFRNTEPDPDTPDLPELIGADVKRYEISSVGPP